MGRRVEIGCSQDPHLWVSNPQRIIKIQRFSPRSKGSKSQNGLPHLGVMRWEDKAPEGAGFEGHWGLVFPQKPRAVVGNRILALFKKKLIYFF